MNSTGKLCTKCKEWKPFEEYHKKKTTPDGYQFHCKECVKKYKRKHYESNRKEIITKTKQYKIENYDRMSEARKETDRKYYQENKETILEKQRKYIEENHEHVKEIKRNSYHRNKVKATN
ncbi:hypothetical protein KM915_18480 [Cytobacillus oceanisediminis]|uniref:hypothetical protein n=1 Tax=Cytobacillus TaxID=2675230 RepID=UPI001C22C313|nr:MULTISPECIES: hypothetical protein [Cytobacillus]MBU8732044.1 hypothetical protein [Cytobacillus oceanisediminis]WHY35395.1 hypothetical protein QNH44_06560 [Cytobacillus firmus]